MTPPPPHESLSRSLIRRRIKIFFSRPKFAVSAIFFLLFTFCSLTAEVWSNDKPLVLSYSGHLYFPVFKSYSASEFGQGAEALIPNFKRVHMRQGDWALWPPNRWNPYAMNRAAERFPAPPSNANWLGTDDRGRDLTARMLYGFRYALIFAVLTWFVSTALGLLVGAACGSIAGRFDLCTQRIIEVIATLPQLLLLIYIISIFDASLPMLVIASCAFGWVGISGIVRSEALRTRNLEYVTASRAMGASSWHIIRHHIFPNCFQHALTFAPFMIVGGITGLAALDYIGLGLPPPTPSWGELLRQAEAYYTFAWWIAFFPSLALFLTLLSLTFVGDGIRSALGSQLPAEPRERSHGDRILKMFKRHPRPKTSRQRRVAWAGT